MKPDLYSVEPDGTKTDKWIFEELLGDDPVDDEYAHNIDAPTSLSYRDKLQAYLLDWDEAQHPRDDAGRFAAGVGGAVAGETSAHRQRLISEHVQTVADRLGYNAQHVDVVDIPPREMVVAGRTLHEGGRFDPNTDRIEINARVNTVEAPVQGLIAHEMMHAQDATVSKARLEDHADIRRMMDADKEHGLHEFDRLFGRSGYPKASRIPEIEARWPVAAAMAKTHPNGDSYLGTWSQGTDGKWAFDEQAHRSRAEQMQKDDGFTAYSKLYWAQVKQPFTREYWRAVQETVAEVGAYQDRAPRGPWKEGVPAKSWQAYGRAIKEAYPKAFKSLYPFGLNINAGKEPGGSK